MERLTTCEGDPVPGDLATVEAVRRRIQTLEVELRPRRSFLQTKSGQLVIQNLIGAVQVTSDLVLDIEPKTRPDQNWQAAVFDLAVNERAVLEGYNDQSHPTPRRTFPDAWAAIYADQLTFALRREGPLTVLVQVRSRRPRLAGRLDVTSWTTSNITRPHLFPQQETVLTTDNPFSRAMAWVAEALASRCSDPRLASRLRVLAEGLRPGLPADVRVDPGVASRPIPTQWSVYGPAWVTVRAVLRQLSPVHRSGVLEGLGLAIEPWPLLETLLHRTLRAAARQAQSEGLRLEAEGHRQHRFLTAQGNGESALNRIHTDRAVDPDGLLRLDGRVVATFEAKYSVPNTSNTRDHIFQAMTTAAALDSTVAVLVYPEASQEILWDVRGFGDSPGRLMALGLDMFGYRIRAGEEERGARLLACLKEHGLLPSAATSA
jgi:hypothetical protein